MRCSCCVLRGNELTTGGAGALVARMRTLWMVVVVLLVGSNCARKRGVFIPNTPEGNTCKRECMNVRASCDSSGRRKDRKVLCPQRELDCMVTCPGAVVDGDREEALRPMQPPAETPPPPPPTAPTAQAGPPRCVASELPEWQGADAVTKKRLMAQCRAPAE